MKELAKALESISSLKCLGSKSDVVGRQQSDAETTKAPQAQKSAKEMLALADRLALVQLNNDDKEAEAQDFLTLVETVTLLLRLAAQESPDDKQIIARLDRHLEFVAACVAPLYPS